MANCIYLDTIKQLRSKFDLEQKIDRLFCCGLKEIRDKKFDVFHTPSETGKTGTFSKNFCAQNKRGKNFPLKSSRGPF